MRQKTELDDRIELEEARLLARQLPVLIFTGTLLPCLVSIALTREISMAVFLAWMAPLFGIALFRLRWWSELRRAPLAPAQKNRFLTRMLVTAFITGTLWGALGIVVYSSSSLENQLILLVITNGMVAGAVNSLGARLPIFLAFSLPQLATHIGALAVVHQSHLILLAVLTVAFMVSMVYTARNTNQSIRDAIRLRFENEALAEERDRQRRLAEEASADKSRFLAAASHDLRQPLHALSLFFGSLEERNHQPDLQPILGQIRRSLDSLHGLFSSLMDLSRLDAGAQRPAVRDFPLDDLLQQIELEHFLPARAKGLSLRVHASSLWVASDPVMLKRMLDNLVANAIRYTDRGGVLVGCRRRGHKVVVQVWDTGVGIAPEAQADVFREFVQLSNPERNRERGLGLGLAIVRRLSLLLDHTVDVASRPERGSRFQIHVPLAGPAALALVHEHRQLGVGARRSRILVIDDDYDVRAATAALLADWGHTVETAESEERALELLRRGFAAHVLIVDYRLAGGENGVKVAQRLVREMREKPQVLFVSGDPVAADAQDFEAGRAVLLAKPLSAQALRVALAG